jgi:aryl-alcohol dehydrogenase-like predicted oxidoreductase
VPIPETTKLHRFKENLATESVLFNPDQLEELTAAA